MPGRDAADLTVTSLRDEHDRVDFACGVESLDRYLKTQAGQDMRRKANAVFVLAAVSTPSTILGYFTLCATSLDQGDVPEAARKHVPRYPVVSATLLGRLAIASAHHRQGLGAVLLGHALQRAYDSASSVGSSMVVVDAIDEAAVGFYEAHRFTRLDGASQRLVLPMHTIGRTLG